jgi:hypothetical protein
MRPVRSLLVDILLSAANRSVHPNQVDATRNFYQPFSGKSRIKPKKLYIAQTLPCAALPQHTTGFPQWINPLLQDGLPIPEST